MDYGDIFENDIKQEMHLMFSSMGIKIPIRNDFGKMLLEYLTVRAKLVSIGPRRVLINPDLEAILGTHPKRIQVEDIRRLLSKGENVNFFQSKTLFETGFHDHLLYEWKIFHFHLSSQYELGSKFIKRTNQLLFIYIDDKEAILLDIKNHSDGVFADEKWLEILDNHFPYILKPFTDTHIKEVYPKVNSAERQNLWYHGLTLGMTKVNGKIIRSPGIGRTTSGHSLLVVKTRNEILRWLHQVTKDIENKVTEICHAFALEPSSAIFKIQFGEVTLELLEITSGRILLTYPYLFNFNVN